MATYDVPWGSASSVVTTTKNAASAIKQVGLNWEVTKESVLFAHKLGEGTAPFYRHMPNKYVTVRKDTEIGLGVVGSVYTPLQNSEAFGFMDEIVEAGAAKYKWAGELRGGRKVYVLVDLNM